MQQVETGEGAILGTVAYMSPEQAEGKKVDSRSDIFSFGILLYQMLTGARPFRGDTKVSTMAAIIREDPPPAGNLVAGLPGEVDRVLARCLRKDPARRFQNMADLKLALEELQEESSSGNLGVRAPAAKRRWPIVAGLAALLVAIAAVAWVMKMQFKPAPPQTIVPLTTYPGSESDPTFSPDGSQVAFSWDGEKQDNYDIYIKQVDGGTPVRLTTDPAFDIGPAWSPDGWNIAFIRSSPGKHELMSIPSIGGPERKLAEITGIGVAWSPDAKWLAFADGSPRSLYLLSLATGERRRLTTGPIMRPARSGLCCSKPSLSSITSTSLPTSSFYYGRKPISTAAISS